MTKLKGYRTLSLGVLTMAGAAIQASTDVLSADQAAEATAIIGALIIFLRTLTDTPLGQGGAKQ